MQETRRLFRYHWTQWRSNHPHNYEFTLRVNCFCPPELTEPVQVRIVADSVVEMQRGGVPLQLRFPWRYTIDSLFVKTNHGLILADTFSVEFDSKLHYPTRGAIDYLRSAADDEIEFIATGLTPVE